MAKPSKGESITLPAGSKLYFIRTNAEVEALYEADRQAGVYMDSAGEPILHSRQGAMYTDELIHALVIETRNVPWASWNRKPVGLVTVRFSGQQREFQYVAK